MIRDVGGRLLFDDGEEFDYQDLVSVDEDGKIFTGSDSWLGTKADFPPTEDEN